MITKEQVEATLENVHVPGMLRSITDLNLLRSIEIRDSRMKIGLSDTALSAETQDWLRRDVQDRLRSLDGVERVAVDFKECKAMDINQIDRVVAVMSGKGGVGKSLVSGLLAVALARRGKQVGILDGDITGPSIPKMFGVHAHPSGSDSGLLPVLSKTGIEIMSVNLLLRNEDDAVIWRGPLLAKWIHQFWEDVLWGKLDCLVLDLPPGTADVPLTVMQSIPLSGVIIVSSPQDLASMVVRKAVNMARQMNVPILGVIENMSYFAIPETGRKLELFGKSRAQEMADMCEAPLLGQIPIDPELARLCDAGEIEDYHSDVFTELEGALTSVLSPGA